jgi:Domain of unknown function (DUF4249)
MRESVKKYFMVLVVIFIGTMCRKPYEPAAIKASNHFVAIDGIINTTPNSSTTINLSRSLNLLDSATDLPELGAQVSVLGSDGSVYYLLDTASDGNYVSPVLSLNPALKYQVAVTTVDGNKYQTDPVTPKASPSIDSLNWEVINDPAVGTDVVNIYVNSHDPTNNTRYYRWDYLETWQHNSVYETSWTLDENGFETPIFPTDARYTHNCWTTAHSTSILLGTTITLSDDVISSAKVANFLKNDPKMDIEYSILLRQYPLDAEGYKYWLTVQKNSQSLGGLFDLQPSQIKGNFHSITHPNDPALGYISASSVQEKRIFISNRDLPGWQSNLGYSCQVDIVQSNPDDPLHWIYPDTAKQLWYFVSGPPPLMKITNKLCLDCRYQGGTNIKPSFWQ